MFWSVPASSLVGMSWGLMWDFLYYLCMDYEKFDNSDS